MGRDLRVCDVRVFRVTNGRYRCSPERYVIVLSTRTPVQRLLMGKQGGGSLRGRHDNYVMLLCRNVGGY